MKKRVIWKMFALTLLTLGIYRLYWFVKTRKEMMSLNPAVKIMSPWFLLIPVVLVIAATGFFIASMVKAENSVPSYCASTYSPAERSSDQASQIIPKECQVTPNFLPMIVFYAVILAIGPLVVVWLWGYAKGVETVTHEKTSFAMSLIVLLLVPDGIDILIIQDSFNKIALPDTTPAPAAAPAST